MRNFKTKESLKKIKTISFLILIIAITCISFGNFYVEAIFLVISAIFIEWKFYRCPHCNRTLDPRMPLKVDVHCPHCGKKI